ncbi:hypothetical protein ABZ897_54610 [Nonomuraea sp. NPDC046802]|uniref:hypothetical protein n=1 Tax=Nonomuraea sp. NPDC046802 TaxID=3154919 RepID=UPI0033D826BD
MGKFDGMDPKLVRDLLTEVKHAAAQMRTVEDRVRAAMSRAGVSTQTTHRPAQVADAVDVMVRDVNVRLETLEKRVEAPDGAKAVDGPKDDVRGGRDRYDNPRADEPPSKGDEPKTRDEPPSKGDEPKTRDEPPSKGDEPKTRDEPPAKVEEPPSKGDEPKDDVRGERDRYDNPRADEPPSKGDEPKTRDEPPSKGDKPETGDGAEADSGGKDCDDAKDTGTGKDTDTGKDIGTGGDCETGDRPSDQPVDQPKDDDLDSRRDRGAENDGGTVDIPDGDTPVGDQKDPTKPQIVVVDGVKVLQVPIDPPTAEQLEDLLGNTDDVKPADMPKMPADSPSTADVNGEYGQGAWTERDLSPDGDVGSINPGRPSTGGDAMAIPSTPVPDDGGSAPTPSDNAASTAGEGNSCDSGTDRTPGDKDTAPDTRDTGTDKDTGTGKDTTPDGRDAGTGSDAGTGRDTTPDGGDTGAGKDTVPDGKDTRPDGLGPRPDLPVNNGDQGAGDQGKPFAVPPTNPSATLPTGAGAGADVPPTTTTADAGYGAEATNGTNAAHGASGFNGPIAGEPIANGGATVDGPIANEATLNGPIVDGTAAYGAVQVDGNVVIRKVGPVDPDSLRMFIDGVRDIKPMEMPSVEIPSGEGDRALGNDVDPGTPERSA